MTPEAQEIMLYKLINQAQQAGPDPQRRLRRCLDALHTWLSVELGQAYYDKDRARQLIASDDKSLAVEAFRALIAYETDGQFGEDKKG